MMIAMETYTYNIFKLYKRYLLNNIFVRKLTQPFMTGVPKRHRNNAIPTPKKKLFGS